VRHNTTFESQVEGPEYYADVDVHDFVGPEHAVGMTCGHPLSARRVKWTDVGKRLITDCWACAVEAEPTNRPGWPSRARATWDNDAAEYSGPIAHNAQRPSVRLYSEREGVGFPEYRRNA